MTGSGLVTKKDGVHHGNSGNRARRTEATVRLYSRGRGGFIPVKYVSGVTWVFSYVLRVSHFDIFLGTCREAT